jgi:hypothetical protein
MPTVSLLLLELLEFLQLLGGQHGAQLINDVALQRLHLLAPVRGRQLRARLAELLVLRALAGEDLRDLRLLRIGETELAGQLLDGGLLPAMGAVWPVLGATREQGQ